MGYAITKIIEKICKNMDRRKTNRFFKHTQIIGALVTCFMNGAQDGQKFIAILLLGVALSSGNINSLSTNFTIPIWLILYASTLIAIGTITGGLKIIKTIGTKVAKVERYQGTAADVSSAICLLGSSITGIPVSSTHTKNSAVMGVAASRRLSNVNWITARNMILTWIFTFPCCGLLGFVITKVLINVFYAFFASFCSNILIIPTYELFLFSFIKYKNILAHLESLKLTVNIIQNNKHSKDKIEFKKSNIIIDFILIVIELCYAIGFICGLSSNI
jgi:hypothetical protein